MPDNHGSHFVSNSLPKNHREVKKIFISEHIYVVNLVPAVMTLPFGANMISAIWCGTRTSPIGSPQHQYYAFSATTATLPAPNATSVSTANVGAVTSQSAMCFYCTMSQISCISQMALPSL